MFCLLHLNPRRSDCLLTVFETFGLKLTDQFRSIFRSKRFTEPCNREMQNKEFII
jgi:hypothetical protein